MLLTTRSAVFVRGVIASVFAERTAVPRPRRSSVVSWRTTGHERSRLRMPTCNTPERVGDRRLIVSTSLIRRSAVSRDDARSDRRARLRLAKSLAEDEEQLVRDGR